MRGFLRGRWGGVLAVAMLLVPNGWICGYYAGEYGGFFGLAFGLVSVSLLAVPLTILPGRWWLALGCVGLLLWPFELTSLLSIGEPLNFGVYWSIRASTYGEAVGQVRAYVWAAVLFSLFLAAYVALMVWQWEGALGRVRFRGRCRWRLLAVVVGVLLLAPLGSIPAEGYRGLEGSFWGHYYVPALKRLVNGVYPADLVRHTLAYSKARAAMDSAVRARRSSRGDGELTVARAGVDSVLGVLILGETSRACNWSLLGYTRETNPRLKRREGLYFFTDAYSGANYTQLAAPMLVSPSTPRAHLRWLESPFVTEALGAAGFRTGWVTQQSGQEVWASLAMAGCDYTHIVDTHFPEPIRPDEELLPYAGRFLTSCVGDGFLVMHTYGGHFYYADRYPERMAYFLPALPRGGGQATYGPEDREVLLNSFDNTVRYTDSIIDAVISILESTGRPSFLVYVPDHGENLFDAADVGLLHATRSVTHWEQHVPLLVWLSPRYREAYPAYGAHLLSRRDTAIQTTSVYHTLLELAGVRCSAWDSTRSLVNPCFAPVSNREVLGPYLDMVSAPSYPAGGCGAGPR